MIRIIIFIKLTFYIIQKTYILNNVDDVMKEDRFTIRSIIKDSWNIFIKNWISLLMIVLIVNIPLKILDLFIPVKATDDIFLILFSIPSILNFLFGIIATIGICFIVKSAFQKKSIDWKTALKKSFERWPYVIITQIILTIIMLISFALVVIPGIIVMIYLIFTIYCTILNDKFAFEAIRYSFSIVKKRWWRTLGYILLLGIFSAVISLIITLPAGFIGKGAVIETIFSLLNSFTNSFFIVASIILFFNYESSVKKSKSFK